MKNGAVREGDGHHTIARRYPFRAPVADSRSLSPHLQSTEVLMTLSIESLIENNFPLIDHTVKSSLLQILEPPEQFFHISQQSTKVSVDYNRRKRLSNELKRRADIEHYRDRNVKPASLHQEGVDIERVTLTMEVTYSDYEEMFTKRTLRGTTESCANIMFETNTIIQFPDRDEINPDFIHQVGLNLSTDLLYYNVVTITGNLADVEEARIRLRKFCPVVLMFAVSERLREDVAAVGLNQWLKGRIEDGSINFPNILIQALPHSMSASFKDPVIRISGRIGDENLLLQTCEHLRELLFAPEVADKVSFSTHMEVPATQRSQLVGTPDGAQLLVISRFTKALLHFPSHSEESSQTLFFYFTGQPESVLKARRFVQGLLPMQLCFHAGSEDLRARIEAENRMIKFYDEVLRVSVRVVPSDLESLSALPGDQMRHYISLKTSEYNVGALYAVMRRVLKRGDEIPMVTPTDYSEMLPLVPDLIKHACEVNVKCRLEPRALDLSTLSSILTPLATASSHSLAGNIANYSSSATDHLAESVENSITSQSTKVSLGKSPLNRHRCRDTSVDTTSSVQLNRTDSGAYYHISTTTSRSRQPSPSHGLCFERCNSRYSEKESVIQKKDLLPLTRSRLYYNERRVRISEGMSLRTYRFGGTTTSNSKHHLALRCREDDVSTTIYSIKHVISGSLK
ncbi:hypothetical protein DICVIV_06654 [Dictyocaulus viviparus]|uniref:Defective in germ line development protein 3-like KH5 domain-containing protein n=1 Tax=Dictyocaulus viviparus TaxID=29172 RepID=A0A0D8XRF9_DICVI|nr:hypothetical protein DICVIV_06654 [Dictyocaulus viviparus]